MKNRLKSYLKITNLKTQSLHEEANNLEYKVLRSDIEALIEESRLIKTLKPKYNVLWMDDKTYSYVYFSKENFPRVFIGHENLKVKLGKLKIGAKIGPFTDGGALRIVLKLLRRPFPYCTCFQLHLRDCLNAQIGKCLGFCCKKNEVIANSDNLRGNIANRKQYLKNIRAIKMVLNGRGKKLLGSLKDEKERWALERIFEHKKFLNNDAVRPSELEIQKIECYDNSNFAGKEAVGAMTTLTRNDKRLTTNDGWTTDKNQWRKFKIKSAPTRDDPRMIGEILERRLNHPEWPYPDLIVIDGGITQYRAAKRVLDEFHKRHTTNNIQLISYAKPQRKVIGMSQAPRELQELIERIIHQTHNFVIRYHRQVREREFIPR